LVGVAVKVTLVPEQIVDPSLLLMLTEDMVVGLTVIVIPLLFIEELVTQLNDVVKTQVTTSPLFNDDELNVLLFVPTLLPFTFH
jgi:hypothetical protein